MSEIFNMLKIEQSVKNGLLFQTPITLEME